MLTLKDLAQYLPYGIYGKTKHGSVYKLGTFNNMLGKGTETRTIDQWLGGLIMPSLYPLSMLTKEIEHNGERFVPMEEISIYNQSGVDYLTEMVLTGQVEVIVYEMLLRWHIWTGDQTYFEKGLIIDKSKQPYSN